MSEETFTLRDSKSNKFKFSLSDPHSIFEGTCDSMCFALSLSPAYGDMFPHKHVMPGKSPFPVPPIPGWDPDTNPWDDYLYPPLNPKPKELTHHKGE